MARRKQRLEDTNLVTVLPRTAPEEIATERYFGLAHPPEGVTVQPQFRDELSAFFARSAGGGGGWGAPVVHAIPHKIVGRGPNRRIKYIWVPATGIVALVLGAYAADRVGIAIYNAVDNAAAKAFAPLGAKANPITPLDFPTWLAPMFNLNSWIAGLQAVFGGAPGAPTTTPPPPNPGIGGNLGSTGSGGGTTITAYNASRYGNRCLVGYTLMSTTYTDATGITGTIYLCVLSGYVSTYVANGYAVVTPQPPPTTQGGT